MKFENLIQPPLNTTMMGVLVGAANYYRLEYSTPMVFGLTGHAFLINIHENICPSSPYVWRLELMLPLIENLGIWMTDLGFFTQDSHPEERAKIEIRVQETMDDGIVCALCNTDHQLITGYDQEMFYTAQPWMQELDYPPATLSFGSWAELGDEIHINFCSLEKVTPTELLPAILDSLHYAVSMHKFSTSHNYEHYGIGPDAYAHWAHASDEELSSHGNWWNGTVWAECRQMAARYFAEIGALFPQVHRLTSKMETAYTEIYEQLMEISREDLSPEKKRILIRDTFVKEVMAISKLSSLGDALEQLPSRLLV